MSAISPLSSIPSSLSTSSITSAVGSSSKEGADFGSVLKGAIQNVNQLQTDANQNVQQFLQGNGELHNVALATQRAEMAFDLGMQVRNKVVSAYQEVMKMQL
jgi:flagellar hook-basal body complex protein FliE